MSLNYSTAITITPDNPKIIAFSDLVGTDLFPIQSISKGMSVIEFDPREPVM